MLGETMKHPLAVAVHNGFTAALAAEIENGNITYKAAGQLSRFAMAITMEYLKGTSMFGKKLQDFYSDGEMYESALTANKIHLQKFGDS